MSKALSLAAAVEQFKADLGTEPTLKGKAAVTSALADLKLEDLAAESLRQKFPGFVSPYTYCRCRVIIIQ